MRLNRNETSQLYYHQDMYYKGEKSFFILLCLRPSLNLFMPFNLNPLHESNVRKIPSGDMFSFLFHIFAKFMFNSQVIFQGGIDTDDAHYKGAL